MRIVIIGAGTIGCEIIKNLASDKHHITIVDDNKILIESLVEKYDIQGVVGNGASLDIQMEAGMNHADVAIVVTHSDELNIFACMVAKKLGVKNTVARVRNPEYRQQIAEMQNELGISMIVNPELDTANEIFNLISLPAIVDIERFANGKVLLVEVAIDKDSNLVDETLISIGQKFKTKILICAVQRGNEVVIPSGRFTIKEGDKICFTAQAKDLRDFLTEANIIKTPLRNIMIVGGNRVAYYLAKQLAQKKYKIKLIEKDMDNAEALSDKLDKVTVVCGPYMSHDVLMEEGIENIDVFVALTDADEENVIISMFANKMGIKRTITQIQGDDLYDMLDMAGIENNVSPKAILADSISSYIRALSNSRGSNVLSLYRLVKGQVEALEFDAKNKHSKIYNKPLRSLKIKSNCLIACIIRNDRVIIPDGNTDIQLGDHVVVVTTHKDFDDLSEIFI